MQPTHKSIQNKPLSYHELIMRGLIRQLADPTTDGGQVQILVAVHPVYIPEAKIGVVVFGTHDLTGLCAYMVQGSKVLSYFGAHVKFAVEEEISLLIDPEEKGNPAVFNQRLIKEPDDFCNAFSCFLTHCHQLAPKWEMIEVTNPSGSLSGFFHNVCIDPDLLSGPQKTILPRTFHPDEIESISHYITGKGYDFRYLPAIIAATGTFDETRIDLTFWLDITHRVIHAVDSRNPAIDQFRL